MPDFRIQDIFRASFHAFRASHNLSDVQRDAALAIIRCKSEKCGCNISVCTECGHTELHYNSCRNRICPNCQAVNTLVWVDQRRAEVIDAPYFHVVFTLPHDLNPLLYCNQKLLYGLLHTCCAQTLLELSSNPEYLGAVPGIIQILHTWNQELDYHVHMHCIISGGGLTPDLKIRKSKKSFLFLSQCSGINSKENILPCWIPSTKRDSLCFPLPAAAFVIPTNGRSLKNRLYSKDWCPYIKETFRGFGSAVEYLGKYTHKVAISNSRILSVTDKETTFSARGRKPGDPRRTLTLSNTEFIRRFLLHVLPRGFQKIRYCGFLNNRDEIEKPETDFQASGASAFPGQIFQSFHT